MEDLHNDINTILTKNGFCNIEICEDTITCCFDHQGNRIQLICKLGANFPYELPKVYIEEKVYCYIGPLPHINPDRSICTFDRTMCIPNFFNPLGIIAESLIQAQNIIIQGIAGTNREDFLDEINVYWHNSCSDYAESIVTVTSSIKMTKLYYTYEKVYLADSKWELDSFLYNIGIHKRYESHYHDCIYLPLSEGIYPPFPVSNLELYDLITKDPAVSEAYRKFVQERIGSCAFVLTSIPSKTKHSLQLWMHTKTKKSLPGFRKNRVPARISYFMSENQTPIFRFSVSTFTQDRLFSRGGTGIQVSFSKCGIIGCGSIGGYLAEALSEYGLASYVLNDNETLSAENIARHYCGYEYLAKKKPSAVSDKLKKHNPNIKTEVFFENGLSFIENHCDTLNACDCIFMATAYAPLEYKVVEKFNVGEITKPIVLIWVEPYLAAGHALIIQKHQDIFSELFGEDFSFSKSVILNPADFQKKESGCQSTYIPYSAFLLKRFIYTFLDYLVFNIFQKRKQGNYLYTWCGKISEIPALGGTIAPHWASEKDFTTKITRID